MKKHQSVKESIRSIAIVGSGLSGLSAGIFLQQAGKAVTLFEKSRGPGGRLAAKRTGDGAVDIGAQYFTVRNPVFRQFLDDFAGPDSYAEWRGRLRHQGDQGQWANFHATERYVGVPRMTAISRRLSQHLDVRAETRVAGLTRDAGQWLLEDTAGGRHGPFDAVLVTAPPAQTRTLLSDSGLDLDGAPGLFDDHPLAACWAVAACFADNPCTDADGLGVRHPVLDWAANNSSKPGRAGDDVWWVLHARSDWSERHQDADPQWVTERLLAAFAEVAGVATAPFQTLTHRWLYARTVAGSRPPGYVWDDAQRLGLCGDWLQGGRVEGAFESAEALVRAMR
ncbi:NAD(P)/FAD-dependent oxidoreductase [Marinobacter bohaiensis]|uniref:NAD(P)/FAD-dependent oxidoreductase n=1 Tax=Marinobacter bohaiensis TaxID=2201898 RepID=UPI000DABFADA|nr:FAD-dependent oxidoreductase [Marinobacter bohaiensis]